MDKMDNYSTLATMTSCPSNQEADNTTDAVTYSYYPEIRQPVHMIVIYSLAYSLVFLLALAGNSLVVSVVYR